MPGAPTLCLRMIHHVTAGTDGATLALFDPAALPPDFDSRFAEDPVGLAGALQNEGRFWFGGTGGDGSYQFTIAEDEPPPTAPAGAVPTEIFRHDNFQIPSGKLFIAGMEYAANDPMQGSDCTPKGGLSAFAMGRSVEVRPGVHRLVVTQLEYDEDERSAVVGSVLPPGRRVTRGLHQMLLVICYLLAFVLGGIGGLAFVIALLGKLIQGLVGDPLFAVGWHAFPWFAGALLLAGALFAAAQALNRLGWHSLGEEDLEKKRGEFPDFIVRLERV